MSVHGNFVSGDWQTATEATPNINPSNVTDVIGEYAQGDAETVATAAAALAGAGSDSGAGGASTPASVPEPMTIVRANSSS